ncbi:MAG: response regulator, partial [Aliifodinibius sp.]|nr:response regulator [Fodinibius sp.]
TVLFVDDMKTMRDQFSYDIHRKTGYEVITAAHGKEALGILTDQDVDVVILDLEMPVMGGLEMLEEKQKMEL